MPLVSGDSRIIVSYLLEHEEIVECPACRSIRRLNEDTKMPEMWAEITNESSEQDLVLPDYLVYFEEDPKANPPKELHTSFPPDSLEYPSLYRMYMEQLISLGLVTRQVAELGRRGFAKGEKGSGNFGPPYTKDGQLIDCHLDFYGYFDRYYVRPTQYCYVVNEYYRQISEQNGEPGSEEQDDDLRQ